MKRALLKLVYSGGGFAPFHRLTSKKILILTYHRFAETPESFSVTRAEFTAHLEYLTKYRQILPLSEINERLRDGKSLPENAAAITIDDGYRDTYDIAFPLLKKFGVPATLFAVTDFLDRKIWLWTDKMIFVVSKLKGEKVSVKIGDKTVELVKGNPKTNFLSATRANDVLKSMPDEEKERQIELVAKELDIEIPIVPPEEYAPVSWEQAREMDANKLKVESHTVTHPILINISEEQLNFELKQSKNRLEEMLGRRMKVFCYPNGAVNEAVWQAVEENGYECAVTTRQGFNSNVGNPFLIKRIDAQKDIIDFAQSVSGFEDFKQRLRN